MFEKWRIKWAGKFGRIEHRFGRWIAVPIIVTIIHAYFTKDWFELVTGIVTFLCWIVYLSAHTIEKKLYGNLGSRSRK